MQSLALLGIFQQGCLLQAQAIDRLLQVLVLLPDVAQIHIVLPKSFGTHLGCVNKQLRRRNQGLRPEADQPDTGTVVGVEGASTVGGAAHLHGQTHDLRHQDGQQHQQVAIADEEGFHKS